MRIAYGSVAETLARLSYTQQDGERETAGEIWQQWNDMPSLVFTGHYGTPIDPRTLNRKFTARCDAAGVRRLTVHDARHTCATLLVDLDVHPRVIMRILRHADQAVTMEIYANAARPPYARRCGDSERFCTEVLLYFAAVLAARELQFKV